MSSRGWPHLHHYSGPSGNSENQMVSDTHEASDPPTSEPEIGEAASENSSQDTTGLRISG